MSNEHIPDDLGGFQQVVCGKVEKGDLVIHNFGTRFWADWMVGVDIAALIGNTRVYRRMPPIMQGGQTQHPGPHHSTFGLPHLNEPAKRKGQPITTGVLDYFPDALLAIAECSRKGNDQHNPGKPLHWDRSKSGDESDALVRHLLERGKIDSDGIRHTAKVAWRALAMLQKELEEARK